MDLYLIAPEKKVVCIPLGFALQQFLSVRGYEGSLRASLGCGPTSFLVGWLGRITAIKATGLFLEPAAMISSGTSNARFVMFA